MFNLNAAVRRMVRGHKSGIDGIALEMGKKASTLDKEIRGATGHKLGLEDAAEIMVICCDADAPHKIDLLEAMAARVGYVLMPSPELASGSMTLERLARLMHECGDVVTTVTEASKDGHINTNELKRCEKEVAELMAACQTLLQGLKHEHDRTMARWTSSQEAE